MQIGWQTGAGPNGERTYLPAQLTVPARYNFNQGYIYRLKIGNIPGRLGVSLYPSIEVAPTTPATDAYLAHNAIPVQFTSEDFDQVVDGGNFVTKVIYLPDPKYQELAVSGVETLVSTRLEPGIDPILEADKRGTILLIVRLGAIDLESPGLLGGAGAPIVGTPVGGAVVNGPSAISRHRPRMFPQPRCRPALQRRRHLVPGNVILDRRRGRRADAADARPHAAATAGSRPDGSPVIDVGGAHSRSVCRFGQVASRARDRIAPRRTRVRNTFRRGFFSRLPPNRHKHCPSRKPDDEPPRKERPKWWAGPPGPAHRGIGPL